MRGLVSVILSIAIVVRSMGPAHAIDLGIKASASLDATVGLDQKTRDFIQNLPAEVRVQVIALLQQALPLIDTSVQSYLHQVDDILNHQVTNIECAVIGTGKTLGSNFAADLKSVVPFSGPSRPEPVQSIKADRDHTVGSFSIRDAPAKYEAAYSDLLYRTAVTACQVKISAEATVDVSDVQQNVHARWLIWYRLINACPNASGCFDTLVAQATALTSKSDSRDLKAVNAVDRLGALTKPLTPGFLSSWNPSMHERALEELLSIKDGIDLARVARETLATNYLTACDVIIQTAEANIKTAQASLSTTNAASNQNAIDHANAASSESNKLMEGLRVAADLLPSSSNRASLLSKRYATALVQQGVIRSAASKNLNAIQAADVRSQIRNIIDRNPSSR